MFKEQPELFNQVYQLLNAGICEAVNGSMVVKGPTTKIILNEKRKLVPEIESDLNSEDHDKMRELGSPSRVMSCLLKGEKPTSENDQKYLNEILAGFGKKLNP